METKEEMDLNQEIEITKTENADVEAVTTSLEINDTDNSKKNLEQDIENISSATTQPKEMPSEIKKAAIGSEEEEDDDDEEEVEIDYSSLDREELVSKLEKIIETEDIIKAKNEIAAIKVAFLKLNKEFKENQYQQIAQSIKVAQDDDVSEIDKTDVIKDDDIEERYKAAFNIYKQKKNKYNEEQEAIKISNLEAKNKLLEELKELINSEETLKKTYDEFRAIQERWKEIGMVPKNEVNILWGNYHFLVEKFFDKVKINNELRDLDLKKNMETKLLLCEKAEELLLENSILTSFRQLQQLHEEWKEVGPVPQDKKDDLWNRFKLATDKINDLRHQHYEKIQEQYGKNLAAKTVLCEQAEDIVNIENNSINQWIEKGDQINKLLDVWKTIGQVPRKQNNEIWQRFRGALDTFFTNKKEYFNKLKEQQTHNYNLKVDLCVQAEALKSSIDWRNTTQELIKLQKEWKNIGPVPKKLSDKIWKRFRSACDVFFNARSDFFKDIHANEAENLKLKESIIEELKSFEIGDNRTDAINKLKEYQRKWMEIGYVPIKEKEKVQNEFREVINNLFEKLKVETLSAAALNYKNKIEKITKNTDDASKVISKEKSFVLSKIQKINEEISIWENNIGFFANSKSADVLKLEFSRKIKKAKEEVETLKAKLKMLKLEN